MTETKFGPKIGGSMDIYPQMRDLNLKVGQKVRVTVPGWLGAFTTEIVDFGSLSQRAADGARIQIGDTRHFLSDHANGHKSPGHDWLLEFEIVEPVLPPSPGLYQIGRGDDADLTAHAITYRHNDVVGWVDALGNKPLTDSQKEYLAEQYAKGNLYRLERHPIGMPF